MLSRIATYLGLQTSSAPTHEPDRTSSQTHPNMSTQSSKRPRANTADDYSFWDGTRAAEGYDSDGYYDGPPEHVENARREHRDPFYSHSIMQSIESARPMGAEPMKRQRANTQGDARDVTAEGDHGIDAADDEEHDDEIDEEVRQRVASRYERLMQNVFPHNSIPPAAAEVTSTETFLQPPEATQCGCKPSFRGRCDTNRCACRKWGASCHEHCKCKSNCDNTVGEWLALLGLSNTDKLHPCFLHWALKRRVTDYSIEKLFDIVNTDDIKDQWYPDMSDWIKPWDDRDESVENQRKLLHMAFSTNSYVFFSFCYGPKGQGQWECYESTTHCYVCKKCVNWREWHCSKCNRCTFGIGMPCERCGGGSSMYDDIQAERV